MLRALRKGALAARQGGRQGTRRKQGQARRQVQQNPGQGGGKALQVWYGIRPTFNNNTNQSTAERIHQSQHGAGTVAVRGKVRRVGQARG